MRSFLYNSLSRYWWAYLLAAAILIALPFFRPGFLFYWNLAGFTQLYRDDLGFGAAWAAVLALATTFVYAMAIPPAMAWMIAGRRRWSALPYIFVVFGITPLLHAVFDSNFNQASGTAQKWFVWRPDNSVELFDNGGFDPKTGFEKRLLTPQVAQIVERLNRGSYPKLISGDPRKLTYFDPASGNPQIWFHQEKDGSISLFDADGFYSQTGELLKPITPAVVADVVALATAREEQQARDARAVAAKALELEQQKRREMLAALFGTGSYAPGTIVVGAKAAVANDTQAQNAAQNFAAGVVERFRKLAKPAEAMRSSVYQTREFDALMGGQYSILSDAGLAAKMRAALLAKISVSCRPAITVQGLTSCGVTADLVLVEKEERASSSQWAATGSGANAADATARALESMMDGHEHLFDRNQL